MASSVEEQKKPIFINVEFAKCGIKDALKGYPTGIPAKILRFFSPGEPTQYMNCIKGCVAFAKSLKSDIKTEIQTNGLFESEGDCWWIANNIDIVWVSVDGPKDINGKYRPDANGCDRTDEIESNIKYLQRSTFVGVRATVVEETVDEQDNLVEHYYNLGIRYLYANPVIKSVKRNKHNECGAITQIDILRFAKGFLKGYGRAKELGMFYGNSLTFNFDEKTEVACRSCLPMPQLNPDDSVSSCDLALYLDAPIELQCFLYGKWNALEEKIEYNFKKIHHLQSRRIENLSKCKDCGIRENCAGGCAGRIAYETGDIYNVIPEYCAATKFLARNMELNEGVVGLTPIFQHEIGKLEVDSKGELFDC
jgi:radical SAM protein with 4Fe4S-binding SPASM domain